MLERNEAFRGATARSNAQILSPLAAPWDWLWLCFLTGISEEALFRGALIPATGLADWRGVLISAAVFGKSASHRGSEPSRSSFLLVAHLTWQSTLIPARVFQMSNCFSGYFHRSGGRNWVFAGWSTWVGAVYGSAFLLSRNLAVPMVAHSLANAASAYIWTQNNGREKQE